MENNTGIFMGRDYSISILVHPDMFGEAAGSERFPAPALWYFHELCLFVVRHPH